MREVCGYPGADIRVLLVTTLFFTHHRQQCKSDSTMCFIGCLLAAIKHHNYEIHRRM